MGRIPVRSPSDKISLRMISSASCALVLVHLRAPSAEQASLTTTSPAHLIHVTFPHPASVLGPSPIRQITSTLIHPCWARFHPTPLEAFQPGEKGLIALRVVRGEEDRLSSVDSAWGMWSESGGRSDDACVSSRSDRERILRPEPQSERTG